jgi:PTH1 family peptidyl-tRNA hydrolase
MIFILLLSLTKSEKYLAKIVSDVFELVNFYKIPIENLLVIYDDYDLVKGNIRIRESGSAGTHNGMRNIIEKLNKTNFPRIRVGFKPTEKTQIPLINLVLSGISDEDKEIFDKAIEVASLSAYDFAFNIEIQKIMQQFNVKV